MKRIIFRYWFEIGALIVAASVYLIASHMEANAYHKQLKNKQEWKWEGPKNGDN